MIRKATLEDLPSLSELFDGYRVFYKQESNIDAVKTFLADRLINNESVIYVTEAQGILTGFTQLYPIFSSTRMQRMWLLNDLFVLPSHRGQGLSLLLLEESKKLCQETAAYGLLLETAKSNDIGNNLYPKAGFKIDNDHNYYFWEAALE